MVEGDQVVVKYGILANNKIAMIEITVNVVPYDDPETAPTGDPKTLEQTVSLSKAYDNTYSSVQFDIKEVLRDAFKMTTYQIHRARVSGDLKIYCGEETTEAPSYTADVPGYWLGKMVRQQSMQMDFVGLVWEPVKQNSIYMVEIIRRMWIRLTVQRLQRNISLLATEAK